MLPHWESLICVSFSQSRNQEGSYNHNSLVLSIGRYRSEREMFSVLQFSDSSMSKRFIAYSNWKSEIQCQFPLRQYVGDFEDVLTSDAKVVFFQP